MLEAVLESRNPVTDAIRNYENAILAVEQSGSDADGERLQLAMSEMDRQDAWDYEMRIKQILTRLKITELNQPVSSLSGGQKKRVALSKILIAEPDLVIMDEPTNHLDMEMIEWLENFLTNKDITLLVVTHDRYFLDRVCTEIIEIEDGKLFPYAGNFSYFVERKAEREAVENSEVDKARNLYRKEIEMVRKMPRAHDTRRNTGSMLLRM